MTIIGYGEMAKALVEGLLDRYKEIVVVGRDEKKLKEIGYLYPVKTASLDGYDIQDKDVILAVKPYALEDVATKLEGTANTLYSILAGIPLKKLEIIKANTYIRAMPNLAAKKRSSMTTLTGDKAAKEKAINIFNQIGEILWVESERELDIATAIAGSGPAFLALIAEALSDGGVTCGLKREDAMKLVKGLFKSSSAILQDDHPAMIKDKVMSPAGTTAAGVETLEERAIRSAFIEAIKKAYERAQNAK